MPAWIYLLIASPFVGSFLGVVVMRDADFARIADGRSRCDTCGATLKPLDLVPIVSFFALRRRCRACGAKLSFFYPLIELVAIVPVLWAALVQQGWLVGLSAVLGWILITLAAIDWRSFRLPDVLTLPLLVLGLVAAWFYDSGRWLDHAIGALAALLIFASLAAFYRALRGREGLGFGDAKFAAALGAFVAWQALPATVLLAAIFALCFYVARALIAPPEDPRIPFGPFLAAGGWITWLYGPLLPGWS